MIIWILMIILVVTIVAVSVGFMFGRTKFKGYRRGIYVGVGICAVLIAFCMVLSARECKCKNHNAKNCFQVFHFFWF